MSFLSRIGDNVRDVRALGLGVINRHVGTIAADKIATIQIPEIGAISMRSGESDMSVIRQVFINKEYQLRGPRHAVDRIAARYQSLLAEGETPIIVDAGANIGAATLWFSSLYPDAKLVAVEPHAGNAALLWRNVADRPNVTVMEAAIGSEAGHVQLVDEGLGWAVQTERADSGLPIVTIDDACTASGGSTPFIVKIDIEGFERDLFASNLDWLAKPYVVIIELHDWMLPGQLSSRTFQQAIAQHPFEMFMAGENIFYVRV